MNDQTKFEIEKYRAQAALELERYKGEIQANFERYKSELALHTPQASVLSRAAIDFALSAIRGLLLINGGAIVALLAFLSTVWSSNAPGAQELAINLKMPLGFFVAGAGASTFTAMLAYLAQRAINESWYRKTWKRNWTADILVGSAILAAFAALIGFGIGSWWAVDAFIVSPDKACEFSAL